MTRKPNPYSAAPPQSSAKAMHPYRMDHAAAFVFTRKESTFWEIDFPNATRGTFVPMKTLDDYLKIFEPAQSQHKWVGESSTDYLCSEQAISNILKFDMDACFVAAVRNPIPLVFSLHAQMLFGLGEDVQDFEEAWSLQDRRLKGERIPAGCHVPPMLQCRNVGKPAHQIHRFLSLVPESQRCIFLVDDLLANPRSVYVKVLEFLDLPDDGRTDFAPANEKQIHRFPWASRILRKPPRMLQPLMSGLRRMASHRGSQPMSWLKTAMTADTPKRRLSDSMKAELTAEFSNDVALQQTLLQRELTHRLVDVDHHPKSQQISVEQSL